MTRAKRRAGITSHSIFSKESLIDQSEWSEALRDTNLLKSVGNPDEDRTPPSNPTDPLPLLTKDPATQTSLLSALKHRTPQSLFSKLKRRIDIVQQPGMIKLQLLS